MWSYCDGAAVVAESATVTPHGTWASVETGEWAARLMQLLTTKLDISDRTGTKHSMRGITAASPASSRRVLSTPRVRP